MRSLAVMAILLLSPFASAVTPSKAVTITASAVQARVHPGDAARIALRTINTTAARQTFRIMTCSWADEWQSDDAQILPQPVACSKNFETTLALAPGAVDQRTIDVSIGNAAALGPHVVRLGFTAIGSKETLWSAPVTLQVVGVAKGLAISASHVKPREIAFTIKNTTARPIELSDALALQRTVDYEWIDMTSISATGCAEPPVRCTTLAPGASLTVTWHGMTCGLCVCHANTLAEAGNYRLVPSSCDGAVDYREDPTKPMISLPES